MISRFEKILLVPAYDNISWKKMISRFKKILLVPACDGIPWKRMILWFKKILMVPACDNILWKRMISRFKKILLVLVLAISTLFLAGCKNSDSLIKSIYIGRCTDFNKIVETLEKYGANAVVIDVKDDLGQLFPALPVSYDARNRFIDNRGFENLLKQLKEKKIYTIARVVALKEFVRTDLCIKEADGSEWIDKEKMSWMDPCDEKVLQYLEEICTAAAKIGFDEVQLDYVRFSSYFRDDKQNEDKARARNQSQKNGSKNRARINAINHLLDRIGAAVHKLGAKLSVCVFGCTIEGSVDTPDKKNQTEKSAEILGQSYLEIAERADYICPMIYPSHYPKNTPCGIEAPDLEPYETVKICMRLSDSMLEAASKRELRARVRPYLQAFTAKWLKRHLKYGKKEIDEQIKAVQDAGSLEQWGLFQMAGKYP